MNMMTTMGLSPILSRPVPPIALLRALPPGPLAREYAHLERARRLAPLFAAFDRDDMETAVEMLLAEMDVADGDPDADSGGAEDELPVDATAFAVGGPGCPIADGGCATGFNASDPAWIEWDTRGRHKLGRHGGELLARDEIGNILREGDEDDDPLEANGDERDGSNAEDETLTVDALMYASRGPGCEIADVGEAVGDEHDTGNGEDEAFTHPAFHEGPGCPLSDPGGTDA